MKKVSVIIPTQNREKLVLRALQTVLAQDYRQLEVIVVDDFSSDGTLESISSLITRDARITYIRMPFRVGAQRARIIGIERCTGDFVAFLDSDDELTPDSVEARISAFDQANPNVGIVYGDLGIVTKDNIQPFKFRELHGFSYPYLCKELSVCNYSVMMIRRTCFSKCGFPDPTFLAWQDDDMVMTIGRYYNLEHCGKVVALSRFDAPERISSNFWKRAVGCRKMVVKYQSDIITFQGYQRLALWYLRVVYAYLNAYHNTLIEKRRAYQNYEGSIISPDTLLALGEKTTAKSIRCLRRYLTRHFEYIYA